MNIDKLLTTISLLLITAALAIIAATPPANGYELSIYDAYPPVFWGLLIASIACGVCILVQRVFSEQKSNWWLGGFLVIIFANLIIVGLPFFRGYELYGRADTLSHIGLIKDILLTGHIGAGNYYPLIHILNVNLLTVTGLPQNFVLYLLFLVFTSFFMLNIYLLAISIANKQGQAVLVTAFASPLIFSIYYVHIHPFALSLFMVPLLLYCYHKRERSPYALQYVILTILLVFFLTFFHPTTALFMIVVLLVFGLSSFLYRIARREESLPNAVQVGKNYRNFALVGIIIFFMWYFSFPGFGQNIKMVSDWLIYGKGITAVEQITTLLAARDLTVSQTIYLFIMRYGAVFIYLLASVAALILTLKQSIFGKHGLLPMNFAYALQFVVSGGIGLFILFASTPIMGFPIRIAEFPLVISGALSGLVFFDLVHKGSLETNPRKRFVGSAMISTIAVIILVSSTLSMFYVYQSPKTYEVSYQVTQMELKGMQWFNQSHEPTIITATSEWFGVLRFEHALYGVEQAKNPTRLDAKPIPSHFGYDQYNSIAEAFGFSERYMIISEVDKVAPMAYPENARKSFNQYLEEDFGKLSDDSTATRIYSNGQFEVLYIYGE